MAIRQEGRGDVAAFPVVRRLSNSRKPSTIFSIFFLRDQQQAAVTVRAHADGFIPR